jgi:hypothetical protein
MQDKEVNVEHVISSLLKRYEGGALSRGVNWYGALQFWPLRAGRPQPPVSKAAPSIMYRFW